MGGNRLIGRALVAWSSGSWLLQD